MKSFIVSGVVSGGAEQYSSMAFEAVTAYRDYLEYSRLMDCKNY